MVIVGSFPRGMILLSLVLLSLNLVSVLAQELRTLALEGGSAAAAEDEDFTCSASKDCKIGCCGAV